METLGDAVYMVAGGVPDRNENHAVNVAGLAIELVEKAASLTDPVSGDNLQLRAGQFLIIYLTESAQSLPFFASLLLLCIIRFLKKLHMCSLHFFAQFNRGL